MENLIIEKELLPDKDLKNLKNREIDKMKVLERLMSFKKINLKNFPIERKDAYK